MRVMLKILYKRYACLGFRQWFVNAGVIAGGSVDMAVEGRHYYRSTRLMKESFNAFVYFRIMSVTNNFVGISHELLQMFSVLAKSPCTENLDKVLEAPSFHDLFESVISNSTGSQCRMTVSYLRDVSCLLALAQSVLAGDLIHT